VTTNLNSMDFLAHIFWSGIFFNRYKRLIWAIFFGVAPDIFSWGVFLVYRIFAPPSFFRPPVINDIPPWVFTLYGITHSLVVFSLVALIIYILKKGIPFFLFAWSIHIIIDIFTHSKFYLSTPFLWPISNWAFPGYSWANPRFMILNYSIIFFIYLWIFFRKER